MAEFQPISTQKMKEFGKDYVKILYRELRREGKDATGALINSLAFEIREEAKQIQIILLANDYLKYVDKGRKPGKYPPIKAIAKWVQVKGISKEAIFPIARSIYKFGIKPTNVIQRVIKEFETSPTLQKKYEDEVVNQLIDMINKNYKEI
jgi:hypothetical protein